MSEDRRAQLKRLLESGDRNLQPLTFPQRELWEASPVPVGDVSNHICAFIKVKGTIPPKDCEAAVQRVVERQEVMRLSFLPGKGGPMQMIRGTGTANVRFQDLRPDQQNPEAVEEVMQEIFHEPFDLMKGPLYRVVMLRKAPDDIVLVFAIHHAIADGWSLGVFVQDLCAAYIQALRFGPKPLPPVPMSYSAWGAAERAYWQPAELEARADFWNSQLSNLPRLWTANVIGKPTTFALKRWVSVVPAPLTQEVRELARKSSTTLFSTLLAAFQIALGKWTGKDDLVVGTPMANRSRAAVRETMGYCSGNVPLRGRLIKEQTFAEAHRNVHQVTLDAFANAMPFAELTRWIGPSENVLQTPVYEVRFALQNHPVPDIPVPGLSLKLRMRSTGTARFALGCEVTEDGQTLEVVWLSRSSLFSQTDMETLDRLFQTVLTDVCSDSGKRVSDLLN